LFLGQSVIFLPSLTPTDFEWRLFNVRYGLMMVPFAAIFAGYLYGRAHELGKWILIGLFVFQYVLYGIGYSPITTWADGVDGLSHAKRPDAEQWMNKNYDEGLVLLDDFARTVSVVRSGVPMQKVIYIGNKPYWEESLRDPNKHVTWIIMQRDDTVWKSLYDDPVRRGEMFKYFQKVYTSENILIFRKPK
jgi:hypothetical protein